jgi:hypothetical protein
MSARFPGIDEIRAVMDHPYSTAAKNLAALPFGGAFLLTAFDNPGYAKDAYPGLKFLARLRRDARSGVTEHPYFIS